MAHTQGPWKWQSGNTYFQKLGNLLTGDLVVDGEGNWIAAVWQDIPGSVDTQEANARLIAAAPEQNEALLYAPTPPGTFVSVEGANDWLARYREWYDGQRAAAIAKAEGGAK